MTQVRTGAQPGRTDQEHTSLLRLVGWRYFVIALIARFPYAMIVVGVLTLVVAGRDSLALGGLTSAMVGLGVAVFGPLIGAAADRWGQRPVLLTLVVLNAATLLTMAWVVYSPAPDFAVLAVSLLIGITAPQVAPLSRSRLVGLVMRGMPPGRRERVLSTTMAYESAVDESVFVFGPVLVGVIGAAFDPAGPVIAAAVITVVFISMFALHPTAADGHGGGAATEQAPAGQLFRPGALAVVLGTFGVGLYFGGVLTAVTAYMDELGRGDETGLLYGVMGFGSAVVALLVMLFPVWFTLRARWLVFGAVMLGGAVLFAVADSMPLLVLALLVSGVGIGPTLVTLFSLGAERSPRGRSATMMTMLGSAVIVGQSTSSALNGRVGENLGSDAALYAPIAAASVVLVAAIWNRLLTRSGGAAFAVRH